MKSGLFAFALGLAMPVCAQEQEVDTRFGPDDLADDLIHADVPLYGFDWPDFWPRNFSGGQGDDFTFGCETRVGFGDWQFAAIAPARYPRGWWLRAQNYGVFHCMANFRMAEDRADLDSGEFSRGFFVRLGTVDHAGEPIELWAIQQGARPGSDYILLSRKPGDDAIISAFAVLQRRCPEGGLRESEVELDVLVTEYCAINSRDELLALSQDMLAYPPLGTLTRSEDDAEATVGTD